MATESAQERKLAVILHADVVGSTALVQRDETLAHQRITQAFARFSQTVQSYRGTVHELRGDALVAEFPRASDAVSAALAFQQINFSHNEQLTDGIAPSVRVGISLGEVVIADGTVTGPGVVLAQRVEQLAEPGGVCATAAIYEAAPGRLPFDYLDLGKQSAKGFDDPVQVYAVALKSDAPLPLPEPAASTTDASSDVPARRWARSGAVVLVLVLALGGWLAWQQPWLPDVEPASPEKMAFALPDEPSIAVLPFNGIGGDESKRELLDGLTGTLSAALAAAPRMFVIASRSTKKYLGKEVAPGIVAEELGVRYVLKGDVQWADERMRVTVQLIDAIDGKSLWGERYDREVKDIFQVQDDIVKHILAEVEGKLVWEGSPAIWAGMTDNLDAYLHYLKGQKALFKFTAEGNRTAREHATRAIELDPTFASGWNLLGWTDYHAARRNWGEGTKDEKSARAEQNALKAIELAPHYGSPRGLRASIAAMKEEYDKATAICEEAVRIAPNEAIPLATCSHLFIRTGDPQYGVRLVDKAMRLSPRHPLWFKMTKARGLFFSEDYEGTIAFWNSLPSSGLIRRHSLYKEAFLAAAYHVLGRTEEAEASVERLLKIDPKVSAGRIDRTLPSQYSPPVRERLISAFVAAGIPENPRPVLPDKPSIAVLGFDNLSGDSEQDYFALGVAEDIITDLSKLSGLFVSARNSSFGYRGKDVPPRTIAAELGVRYLLRGSVRPAGETIRINARLVDSETGGQVWAHRFDGPRTQVLELGDRVTEQVVSSIVGAITEEEASELTRIYTSNTQAREAFVRGRAALWDGTPAGANDAIWHFEDAIELDPRFAEAYAGLAEATSRIAWHQGGTLQSDVEVAYEASTKSLSIRDTAEGRRALGAYHLWVSKEFDKASEAFRESLELARTAEAYALLATAELYQGRLDAAYASIEESIERARTMPTYFRSVLGQIHFAAGNYEQAEAELAIALRELPPADRSSNVAQSACVGLHMLTSSYYLGDEEKTGKWVFQYGWFKKRTNERCAPYTDPKLHKKFHSALENAKARHFESEKRKFSKQ